MQPLNLRAFIGLAILVLVMVALLFGAAGTLHYWQGWAFLACYFLASIAITLYLARRDPALLARRMRGGPWAEKERTQKVIMSIASAGFIALLVLPGLDHRFGWSRVPAAAAIVGDLLMLLGWLGIFRVFRENSFTSSTIELAVRHRSSPDVCGGAPDAAGHSDFARLLVGRSCRSRLAAGADLAAVG
jgi:hypothetical protein